MCRKCDNPGISLIRTFILMENLINALGFGGILSGDEMEYVADFFKELELKPGSEFLSIGRISDRIGFVDKGILRIYAVGAYDKEATIYFCQNNQFAVDMKSFYENEPSSVAFQAVTESRILYVQRSTWQGLYEEVPQLYILTKSLSEAALLNKITDNEFLNFGSAKDKYLAFLDRYPKLAVRVPQQYIASYLKITPQSLSRIRRELA